MKATDTRMVRWTTWIAGSVAIVVAISLPSVYFFLSRQHLTGSLEKEAEIKAQVISQVISTNPEMWRFQAYRLDELLGRHRGHHEGINQFRIFDAENRVVTQNSVKPKWPILTWTEELFDSGSVVGRIELNRSLYPLIAKTGGMTILGVIVGLSVFATLQVLPLRTLRFAWYSLAQSEARFQGILDTASDAIISIDEKQQIVLFNKQAESIFGYQAQEILGKPFHVLLPARVAETYKDAVEQFETESPLPHRQISEQRELSGLRKSGEEFPIEISISKLEMEDEPIVTLLVRDVTERKRAEEGLRESEERFRRLSEASFEGVEISENGHILDVNQTFAWMLGYEPRELIGKNVRETHPPEYRDLVWDHNRSGYGKAYEVKCLRKDGSVFPVEIHGRPMPYQGRTVRVTAIRDVTERKRAEEEIQQAQVQLLRSERLASVGTLVAGVAHEVLNPVNSLYVKIQLLQEGMGMGDAKELAESLAAMRTQVERVSKITKNLVTFARKREPQVKTLDLRKVLDEVVALVEYQFRVTNVEIATEYAPDISPVNGDQDQIAQVLLNLLGNAKDAMPEGGRITVRVRPFVRGGTPWVRIAVEDTGTGIPKDVLSRIFDPFFTTKAEGKGTGLGLSISHGIIESHGGKMDVKSVEGEGTTFLVELPANGEGEAESEESSSSMTNGKSPQTMKGLVTTNDHEGSESLLEAKEASRN